MTDSAEGDGATERETTVGKYRLEHSPSQIAAIVDRYQQLRAKREPLARAFLDGTRPYMIFHTPGNDLWSDTSDPEDCFVRNLDLVEQSLAVPSDHLPTLEPWFGTGLYANMYGCDYVWRDGEAPCVHYRFHSLDEVRSLAKPRWEDSDIAHLVLDTIRYFKSKTGDAIPIVWTDTQSAHDTATLILDASEVFTACLTEPETIMAFMRNINALIIEFSKVQAELIGDALVMPGHIMLSNAGFTGMSISDDNLAVGSPAVNAACNLPLDEEIGKAFGGVAIHSCGQWDRTMRLLARHVPSCVAIDCALETGGDPNPNPPEPVRDAIAGTGIHLHVRLTSDTPAMCEIIKRVAHPDIKLIVHPNFTDVPTAERNYEAIGSLLKRFYGV